MPGQAVADNDPGANQILPLTAQLRNELKLTDKMRTAIVLFVEYVSFLDAPQFDDTKTELRLMDFLQQYGDCTDRSEPSLSWNFYLQGRTEQAFGADSPVSGLYS